MEISKDKVELIEKIRKYRADRELIETLRFKNEILEKQNKDLKESLKNLQSTIIDINKLLEQIKQLKRDNGKLRLDLEKFSEKFTFVVTTPQSANTVYGEIKAQLGNAKREVLVCSPWITYLVDEFSGFDKKVEIKIITNFRKEDVKMGITDIDKLRVLKNIGAEIRYNNNLHAKIVVIDARVAIISSANLTKRGLSVNFEAGVLIKDHKQVRKAIEFFNGVWEESEPLAGEIIKS